MITRESFLQADAVSSVWPLIVWIMEMTSDQKIAQPSVAPNGVRDLISRLYREIGISAVAAALEATARKPQKPVPNRKDIPAVLRGDEAA